MGEGLTVEEPTEDLEFDRDRINLGVPWLFFNWLGTCEALTTLHFFRKVTLDQYIPRNWCRGKYPSFELLKLGMVMAHSLNSCSAAALVT